MCWRAGRRSRATATADAQRPDTPWPHIHALIDTDGDLSIVRIYPIPFAAVTSDDHTMYAALLRHDDESLIDLLNRLDAALDTAFAHDIYTDEINA